MLTSKGVAGVSRASLVILMATATSVGLPTEPVFLLLGSTNCWTWRGPPLTAWQLFGDGCDGKVGGHFDNASIASRLPTRYHDEV